MAENTPRTCPIGVLHPHRAIFAFAAALLAVSLACIAPATAMADEADSAVGERANTDFDVKISEKYQEEVDRTTKEYEEAVAKTKEAKAALKENRAKLNDLEEKIPEQAERTKEAARAQYKLEQQSTGVIDMFLNSEDVESFTKSFEYVSRVSDANIAEMERLNEMHEELEKTQSDLKQAKYEADESEEQAKQALEAAEQARAEAQKRAQEKARREAEEAARKRAEAAKRMAAQEEAQQRAIEEAKALAEAKAKSKVEEAADEAEAEAEAELDELENEDIETSDADDGEVRTEDDADVSDDADADASASSTDATDASDEEESLVKEGDYPTETPTDDGADWAAGRQAFVDEWSKRIDRYLEGSEMAGQGATFAEAAWEYGIDPRWSPAIALTESGKGSYCFKSHNAWGWGSESWDSWEEAIDAHVKGLAHGYGYTITIAAAQIYCPPNWVFWYDTTVKEMNSI